MALKTVRGTCLPVAAAVVLRSAGWCRGCCASSQRARLARGVHDHVGISSMVTGPSSHPTGCGPGREPKISLATSFFRPLLVNWEVNILPARISNNTLTNSHTRNTSSQKITKGINAVTTTQTQMARALKISQQRVSQMVKDGSLPTDESGSVLLVEGLRRYFLSESAGDKEAQVDFDKERALHEKAKREIAELKLDKMRKNAYSAKVVEYVMTAMAANLRTQLLGLPSKLAPMLEGEKKEEIYSIMTKEIEEKLEELSTYSPDLFSDEIDEEEDEDEDS